LRRSTVDFVLVGGALWVEVPRVVGAWFGVWGLGCRVQGSGFRVQGSGFRVWGCLFGRASSSRTLAFRLVAWSTEDSPLVYHGLERPPFLCRDVAYTGNRPPQWNTFSLTEISRWRVLADPSIAISIAASQRR
jgi:hypothetical protein